MAAYYNYNQATPNVGQRRPRDDDDFLYRPTSTSTSTSSTFGPSQTQLSRPSYTSPTQPSTSTSNSLILHPTANQEHGTTLDSYQNGEKVSRAAQLIERELTYDEKRVYVLDKLETRENNGWYHYEKTRLSLRRQVAIPQAIIDQYDNLECQSFVGLLPEINRAYITIDNKLFLWNYHDGSDFYLYDDISQLIVSVALIRPRPDVFVKAIKFVLVVATPVEIMLLGVKFDGDHVYGALTLYPTQFSIPSDNIHMLRIVGTATGRILMCGRDGCVYELQYSAKDGWWYNKCRKINHSARPLSSIKSVLPSFLFGSGEDPIENLVIDDSRTPPRLYTLSSRSAIQVYSLGNDGQSMIFQSRNTRILEEAVRVLGDKRTEDWTAKDFKIVNIAVIPRTEAEKIVLVGITSHGHRIYFHLTQSHFHYGGVDLTVRFVRLCPPYVTEPDIRPRHVVSGMITQPYEPGYKKGKSPETIHQAFYRNGVVLMADAGRSVAHDTLIALNPDLDLQSSKLIESVEARDVETRIADLSEVSPSFYLSLVASTLYARGYDVPLAGLNEFATQHALPPRQFLILTSSGLLTFIKHRPIDDLRDILIRRRKTNDDAELVLFFTQYGLKEACAMCLVVACATPQAPVLQITDESTTNRFNIQNNTSTLTTPNRYTTQPTDPTHDIHLQRAAKQAFFRFGAEPDIHPTYETHVGSHLARSTFTASGKHDGLALYLSRLIRPLWDWSIVVYNRDDPRHISLRYSRQHFIELSTPLRHLQSFIHDNIRLLLRDTSRHTPADSVSRQENQSIDAMRILLDLTCQALSLLCILATQNNFVAICNRLSPTDLSRLRDSKFYDLITSHDGHALLRALIAAMMELRDPTQPEDHALVTKLHTECPILFGNGDLLNYKAMECLEKAKLESSRAERDLLLSRAFQLYHTAAHDRYFTLEQACARLRDVHHYSGVVTLCLDRAMWIRSGEISPAKTLPQTYGQVGTSTVTTEQDFIDNETRRCYDCIIETLDVLVLGRTRVKERATSVTLPLTPDEKALMREKVLALSRDSNDPHFLSRLYHWYITNDLTEDLLSTPSPHLIRFLTTSESYVNLLRDYYLRHNMYKPAAILLCELSYKKTDEYTLADRIGFLSRALSCAQKCIDMARTTPMDDTYDTRDGLAQQYTIDGDMAFFLRDRIEIAKIQAKIHSRLKAMVDENYNTAQVQRINEETKENKYEQEESIKRFNDRRTEIQNALKQLDYELFDIDPLYVFAQQFGLWEICLYIFNFSNERNRDDVIRALWSNIFRESIARAVPQHMDWTLIVRDQLIELSRQYHHDENPFIFPLQHIVKELENDNYNYRPHPTPDFVIPSLLAAGISPHSLIDVYDHLIEQSRSEQNDEEKKLMIGSVLMLLEQGTQQARVPRTRGVRQGRFPYDQAFNLISKCLTELQTMQQTPDVERLESDLKSLQSRLRMSL